MKTGAEMWVAFGKAKYWSMVHFSLGQQQMVSLWTLVCLQNASSLQSAAWRH